MSHVCIISRPERKCEEEPKRHSIPWDGLSQSPEAQPKCPKDFLLLGRSKHPPEGLRQVLPHPLPLLLPLLLLLLLPLLHWRNSQIGLSRRTVSTLSQFTGTLKVGLTTPFSTRSRFFAAALCCRLSSSSRRNCFAPLAYKVMSVHCFKDLRQ